MLHIKEHDALHNGNKGYQIDYIPFPSLKMAKETKTYMLLKYNKVYVLFSLFY